MSPALITARALVAGGAPNEVITLSRGQLAELVADIDASLAMADAQQVLNQALVPLLKIVQDAHDWDFTALERFVKAVAS